MPGDRDLVGRERVVGYRSGDYVIRPIDGLDFDENTLPQEAGLETTAVSFTKGCYIGQETVARIHFRGHVNRRLTGLAVQGESLPARGSRVLRGEAEVGRVTSAVRSPARHRSPPSAPAPRGA